MIGKIIGLKKYAFRFTCYSRVICTAMYTVIYKTKGYMMLMNFPFPKFRSCGLELSIFTFFLFSE